MFVGSPNFDTHVPCSRKEPAFGCNVFVRPSKQFHNSTFNILHSQTHILHKRATHRNKKKKTLTLLALSCLRTPNHVRKIPHEIHRVQNQTRQNPTAPIQNPHGHVQPVRRLLAAAPGQLVHILGLHRRIKLVEDLVRARAASEEDGDCDFCR
jgi:hypothetical protein